VWKGGVTTKKFDPTQTSYSQYQNVSVSGDPASQRDLMWLALHTPAN
jgi:hypothetical protein